MIRRPVYWLRSFGCLSMWIVLMILSITGCTPYVEEVHQAALEKRPVQLTFWTLQMLSFAPEMQRLISTYEAIHPQVHIQWVDVPFSEGEKKALTSMLAHTTPDVINLNPDFSALLASKGALLNLHNWVSPVQAASYLPVTLQAASMDTIWFGVPWYVTSAITIYNAQLLSQPPQSFHALANAAETVHQQKSGPYILMPALTEGGRFFRFLKKADILIWGSDGQLVFAQHGAGEHLAYWLRLYQRGLIPQDSVTEGQQSAVDRYQSGSLAMLLTGPNFLNMVRENAPTVYTHTKVAPQFLAHSGYTDFSEMVLVVPKLTRYPKEAVDFALYVTNAENTQKLAALAPVLPPHRQVLHDWLEQPITGEVLSTKARNISAKQLLQAQSAWTVHPQQNRLNQLMDYYVQSAFLGHLTPDAAMQKAQNAMNQVLHTP